MSSRLKIENLLNSLSTIWGKAQGVEISGKEYKGEEVPFNYEKNTLIIKPEYCLYALRVSKQLFQELCNAVPLRGLIIEPDT